MRVYLAAAMAASVFASSAFAMDPFNGQGWQRSRPPAAIAYFQFQFHPDKESERLSYGLAVTAPTPRIYGALPTLMNDTPKLADLRFRNGLPNSLLLSEQVAWSMSPGQEPDGARHNLLGGPIGWALNLALTGAAIYGVYLLVKDKCQAVSTTTGGCVKVAN